MPRNFSCLTLAIGVGVSKALSDIGANGVQLKWPNDLVLNDGKLGGILTEIQPGKGESESECITVVIGIGLNLDMRGHLDGVTPGIGQISDLRQAVTELPDRMQVAAAVIERLVRTLLKFEDDGFTSFSAQWKRLDWLAGKNTRVETPFGNIDGIASGIDDDGALLVQRGSEFDRVVSGTVTLLTTSDRQTGTGSD
jgi:BirA family biotin operon repressor/biotin-[acetyl-CoA-carboxylase] ligase